MSTWHFKQNVKKWERNYEHLLQESQWHMPDWQFVLRCQFSVINTNDIDTHRNICQSNNDRCHIDSFNLTVTVIQILDNKYQSVNICQRDSHRCPTHYCSCQSDSFKISDATVTFVRQVSRVACGLVIMAVDSFNMSQWQLSKY